jgi:hypothetical protein
VKYQVTGPVPIATSKGDVEPGKSLDDGDLDPRTNVKALVAAGHLKPVKTSGGQGPGQ